MRINSNQNKNFGRALYTDKIATVEKQVGKKLANALEEAMPNLEELADNVDIYVDAYSSENLEYRGFNIHIEPVIKNPIKRFFFRYIFPSDDLFVYDSIRNFNLYENDTMAELLVRKTHDLKDKFLAYDKK